MRASPTRFDTFVADVNRWIAPGRPASEDEVLDIWSLGERNASYAAAHIERLRALAAHPDAGRMSLGERLTGALLVPVGIALICLLSLADEADAAPVLVATREGVLAYAFLASVFSAGIGYALGFLTPRRSRPEPTFSDHPEVVQLRGALKARGRS